MVSKEKFSRACRGSEKGRQVETVAYKPICVEFWNGDTRLTWCLLLMSVSYVQRTDFKAQRGGDFSLLFFPKQNFAGV